MVAPLLLIALAVQQPIPSVTLEVDRSDLLTGDAVLVTLRALSLGDAPAEIVNPSFGAFEVADQRDRLSVRIQGGVGTRTTVRQITVRALRAGTFTIGPAEIRQGDRVERSGSVELTVRTRGEGAALAGRVLEFAARVSPPRIEADQVAITVHAVPDSTLVGAQADAAVIAWFPRAVRERLRTPPTLRGPQVAGAWVYHQHVPSAPALARTVDGVPFDLYILHDVLFPLRPGRVEIGAATVSFALPLSNALLSREVRHEVSSAATQLHVLPLPTSVGATVPVGRELRWTVELPTGELRLGDARVATVAIAGRGNVALWPEPSIAWPPGLRTYPEETRTHVQADPGGIGGTKFFQYLVVAESTGTHQILAPRYEYFDVTRGEVVTLEARGTEVVTPGSAGLRQRVGGASSVMLVSSRSASRAETFARGLTPWGWLVVVLMPPLLAGWVRRRRPRARRPAALRGVPSTLSGLAREFRVVLHAVVPDEALREGDKLADALRAAGIDEPVAQHAVRVRDRLRRAVFGPDGAPDTDELVAEVHEVLRVMVGEGTRTRVVTGPAVAATILMACVASGAQAQSAARLYETGAYAAAADSFQRTALANPEDPAAWHNLAAALSQLNDDVGARAAWTRAARMAPRDGAVRAGLARLDALDRRSEALLWVSPLTVAEALLVGTALWLAGWGLVAVRVRWRIAVPFLGLALIVTGYGGVVYQRYDRSVALAAGEETVLLEAPYGSAPLVRRLERGTAMRVLRERSGWLLVERGEERGWVQAAHLLAI